MSLRQDPSDPGLNYTFSKHIQRSLALAAEAARIEDADVGSAYLLLGLLQMEDGVALSVLDGLEVDHDEIIERVGPSLADGDPEAPGSEPVAYTEEAKTVLHYALAEARELGSIYVGTEHLLLALLRMEGTIARQVLNSAGVHVEDARAETLKVWESGEDEGDESDNLADKVTIRVLRNLAEDGDETLIEFLRNIGAEENAAWARRPDGTWKVWDDLDWDEHGPTLWKLFEEWFDRHEEAELQLAEAGLVDPKVKEWEERVRELEAQGKAGTIEHAEAVMMVKYHRAPFEVMQGEEDHDGTL